MNFQDQQLTPDQVTALTACMLSTAKIDGVQAAETALIQQFYDGFKQAGMLAFAELDKQALDANVELSRVSTTPEFSDTLISLCLLTGYADGGLSQAERDHVLGFARAVGMNQEGFDAALMTVQDSLLGSLSHLPDAGSVAALAKEL